MIKNLLKLKKNDEVPKMISCFQISISLLLYCTKHYNIVEEFIF